ncbi:hypothetical protein BRADI_2g09391v3 [Brachypodium distachyon]|uniref:Protein kinase domain-containing protein n=1 Tax=Brachypodium distachyon TaxID=15368 RepID=A0A0Q3MGY2_BRADI|nr:hypothetical protein BRADI_2g09391v3 [Brachypodium distachyon]
MFGVVFKARHRATGQPVAIKTLCNPDHEDEADEARALLREARFLEACAGGNPSIVGFRGVLRDGLTHELSLVMDYVPGQSLHRLLHSSSTLNKTSGLPEDTVRAFMWPLLAGAKRMHACHVVHRDLKPANIIVGEGGGSVKICDFGVALSLQEPPPYGVRRGRYRVVPGAGDAAGEDGLRRARRHVVAVRARGYSTGRKRSLCSEGSSKWSAPQTTPRGRSSRPCPWPPGWPRCRPRNRAPCEISSRRRRCPRRDLRSSTAFSPATPTSG